MVRKNLIVLVASDIILLACAYVLAHVVRFEANVEQIHLVFLKNTIIPIITFKIFVFYLFDLYRGMWRYTSIADLISVIKSIIVSSLIIVATIYFYTKFQGVSRSVFIIDAVFSIMFIAGIRLIIRLILSSTFINIHSSSSNSNTIKYKNLLVIGAGDAGEKVIREIQDNPKMKCKVVGFVDDHKAKIGRYIHGVEVLGCVDNIKKIVKQESVDEILIAAPSAVGEKMRRIVDICDSTNIPYKTLPGMGELIDGRVSIKTIRDISYKDILGRPPVRLENDKIAAYLQDKCVLVTGAGGSIGSELCRQICKYKPSLIILFDISESNLYSIQMELKHEITYVKYRAVLGRIQDKKLVDGILNKYKPDVIFHAAAYKHVPLIERNPWEAVYSNIIGTDVLIKSAIAYSVPKFVLVSTDKAVRPTNVMGASKRVIEKILQSQISENTSFMAVRFGNVIGSSGSVIPLFRRQIEKGGPVTVTHPEITRYFMTIEEAAQLILQAFTMGKGGEIFILEMGVPVKIVDMARDLIRLSGKEPDTEIEIKYTGLRPGEKLYEELITEGEGIVKTGHEKILVLHNGKQFCEENSRELPDKNAKYFDRKISELISLSEKHDSQSIKLKIKEIVPEYTISNDDAVL